MYESHLRIVICALISFVVHQVETTCDVAVDSKAIVDSNRAELIVMKIFPFRSPDERKKINEEVRVLSGNAFIDDTYEPVSPFALPYLDLCFVLMNDKVTILSKFMGHFLDTKDETYIIIVMVLIDDLNNFKKVYDSQHKHKFDKKCEDQRKPFMNMMRVWAKSVRPPDAAIDPGAVDKDVDCLNNEKPKWDDTRTEIERVLMNTSYAHCKAVLAKYAEKNKHPIEDDIKAIIKNKDLIDAYSSLASYITDKYKYLAQKLHDHSDSTDYWAAWNIIIGVTPQEDWSKINDAFKKDNDNISLVDFISKNILGDFVLMETYAHLIDSNYKPLFLSAPAPISAPPPAVPLAPGVHPLSPAAPVPPTAVVPPVAPAPPGSHG